MVLLLAPATTIALLFGSPFVATVSMPVVRLTGLVPLAMGAFSVFACRSPEGSGARRVVVAMAFYNILAVLGLSAAGLASPPGGPLLWPAVALHAAMAAWCAACLVKARVKTA